MATRKSAPTPPKEKLELLCSRGEAQTKLRERILKGNELTLSPITKGHELEARREAYYKWDSFNTELLKRLFTTEELADEYAYFSGVMAIGYDSSFIGDVNDLLKDIDAKIHRLDSIMERLELFPERSGSSSRATGSSAMLPAIERQPKSNKVFIVHGRDDAAKSNLEIFLHGIGLEPVVLHRQADQGMTVIEKFERHSDVGYVFVLLTPDEVAYLKSEEWKLDEQRAKELRARPNVIFEFGYFVGKIGRGKVCCLYTGNVTLPSDVNGMIYKHYTNSVEEVAYGIMKDLRACGYDVKL